MMRGKWSKWVGGVGLVVLMGGLVVTNYGGGMKPAEARGYYHNPFHVIIGKLNDILAKLNNGGGGSGSSSGSATPGNYTTRWDTRHAAATRFTVLTEFGGAAVRDNNTGLVWEQAPSTMAAWADARLYCINKAVGGTRGWRLPSVAELASLIDPSMGAPFVPNVFTGIEQMAPYWTSTSNAESSTGLNATKFSMNFQDGTVGISAKTTSNFFWCVRGAMNESSY